MVATDARSVATCDSSAIVTLSRKVRCTRVLMVRRNHVAVADTPRPTAAIRTRPGRPPSRPSPSSASHSASSASGAAESSASRNEPSISPGSWRYPSLHRRHMDERAGGRGEIDRTPVSAGTLEDLIGLPFLVLRRAEPLRLQVEHRPIAAAPDHQLAVRAELHDATVLHHADAVGLAHRGEAVRDENGRAWAGRGENAIEDLGFAP